MCSSLQHVTLIYTPPIGRHICTVYKLHEANDGRDRAIGDNAREYLYTSTLGTEIHWTLFRPLP